jgi:hypothetical protein
MSLHEEIQTAMQQEIDALRGVGVILPTSLALSVQRRFAEGPIQVHIAYTSLEHLKHFARRALAGRFDAEGEDNETHQHELFSGQLQDRYPTPRRGGQEPAYKLRDHLSNEEVDWNIEMLRKSAYARLEHADAMLAWSEGRGRSLAA